jgi:hypothetical protein
MANEELCALGIASLDLLQRSSQLERKSPEAVLDVVVGQRRSIPDVAALRQHVLSDAGQRPAHLYSNVPAWYTASAVSCVMPAGSSWP